MYIAKIDKKRNENVYTSYVIRHSYREDGKVKHVDIANVTRLPEDVIETIADMLKGTRYAPIESLFEVTRTVPHGNVRAVLGTIGNLGLDNLIASKKSRQRDLVVAMIASRLIKPCSKLATSAHLNSETASSSMGESLNLESVDEDELYEAMDWLYAAKERIENKLVRKHFSSGSLILYDITSSYYTGSACPLAARGYSRDGKRKFPQITYGILCTEEGIPVSLDVYKGNTSDSSTLADQVDKIRNRFLLDSVILVGDCGMIAETKINEELKGIEGLDWITALKSHAIRRLAEEEYIQLSLFNETDLAQNHPS